MALSLIVMGGKGRMGTIIRRLAEESPAFQVVALVDRETIPSVPDAPWITATDLARIIGRFPEAVIIDFTSPEASMETARLAARHGNPTIIGTTGLDEGQKRELESLAKDVPLFLSPNMSLGINVLLEVLPQLTRLLEGYDLEVLEIHHNRKKDTPSGTALRLAEALASARQWELDETAEYCRKGIIGERPEKEIGVQTLRGGDVVGVHTLYFMGPGERIEITHQAHSRDNFANGALRAALWLRSQKPGTLYSMTDVLNDAKK